MKRYFVTGIGTDVGKTVVSAILVQAGQADYWKPIQAGDLHQSDSIKVAQYIQNDISKIHPEQFRLSQPMSPHAAAEIDSVSIKLTDFNIPNTLNHLIIEGAGGLLVPISETETTADLIASFKIPVILVSSYYLGSINHTLLTAEVLKNKNIEVVGIIYNGEENAASLRIIEKLTQLKTLGKIPKTSSINHSFINQHANQFAYLFAE